ncbi:dihydrofolate reductase family protein [Pontiellaceae bacterium B12227]|nr:dihydrofolate reductase family protein [Pontiellaceae bacterium B12227]
MANTVYIATSLDGFIAGPSGELDWLMEFPNPGNSDYGFAEFMERIDALVMGRNTFEMVASFEGDWPYPKPVFVCSNTLTSIPDHLNDKTELIGGEPAAIVHQLNERGFRNLYIDGGKTVQSFMREGLIDELILSRLPILLGDGIPLFGKLDAPQNYTLEHSETFSNGICKTVYRRKW